MKNFEKPFVSATLGEVVEALRDSLCQAMTGCVDTETPKKYVYGYAGLKELLGVSDTSIWRLLKSGVIDAAVSHHGKIIVADADMVLDLLKVRKSAARHSRGVRGGYKT